MNIPPNTAALNAYANVEPSIDYVHSDGRVDVLYPGEGYLAKDTINVLVDDHSCPVCICTHERPLQTRACKHRLCESCFNQLTPTPRENAFFSGHLTKKCPMCRKELGGSGATADAVLEEVPEAREEVHRIYQNCRPIKEPITFTSFARSVWSVLSEILSIPFRIGNTALNFGLFAGNYVTVMSLTTLGALTGATIGLTNSIKSEITRQPSTKSLKDYTVTYAKETFNFVSTPYKSLPRDIHSAALPTFVCAAFFCLEIWNSGYIHTEAYELIFKATYKISHPYEAVTSRTVRLFELTDNYIQSF